jgi:hypothetical protein
MRFRVLNALITWSHRLAKHRQGADGGRDWSEKPALEQTIRTLIHGGKVHEGGYSTWQARPDRPWKIVPFHGFLIKLFGASLLSDDENDYFFGDVGWWLRGGAEMDGWWGKGCSCSTPMHRFWTSLLLK